MKVNIKGLVFVGFAAAILSANAMAADNTVTSKSYVDNKFQTKVEGSNNQLVQATGTAGSVKYLTISDSSTDVNTTNGAGKVVSGKAVADAITANNTDLNLSQYEEKANKVTSMSDSSTDDEYPSAKAVYDAISALDSAAGDSYQSISTEAQKVSDGNGGWEDLTVTGTPTQNSNTPFTAGGAYTQLALKEDVSNKVTSMSDSSTDDEYPSAKAVYDAISALDSAAGDSYQSISTEAQKVSDGNGGWEDLTVTGTPTQDSNTPFTAGGAYTQLALKEDVSNKAAAINAANSTSTDAYASTKAVYDYVQGLPSSSLPGVDTTICDSTHPCALVTDTSTGAAKWVRIVQQGD